MVVVHNCVIPPRCCFLNAFLLSRIIEEEEAEATEVNRALVAAGRVIYRCPVNPTLTQPYPTTHLLDGCTFVLHQYTGKTIAQLLYIANKNNSKRPATTRALAMYESW